MSHNNLLALYCHIETQKQEIEDALSGPESSPQQQSFVKGRLAVLTEFEEFLHSHLDRKLPKRIYRQMKSRCGSCKSGLDQSYALGSPKKSGRG